MENCNNFIYLSYMIDELTPTYGNKDSISITKSSSISNGNTSNNTHIATSLHVGTHLDMPYHFYENGQTIEDFNCSYFFLKNILFIDIEPKEVIICDELLSILETTDDKEKYEIIIVKTGLCYLRNTEQYTMSNYGFHPLIANYIRKHFRNVRFFGFDSISVSSFLNRELGREAHKRFLLPEKPILLLEDMDLRKIAPNMLLKELYIAPFRISKSDGLPCTIIGVL
ncbi:cyclase family protein [Campylobacter lanienae]|uniref:cyclase family protein n=1 Tax=Campylobacter lanienae TaxID=75658 RepID=UPI000BB4393B|nr:cyclase family protein [Campylobacter lanienae]